MELTQIIWQPKNITKLVMVNYKVLVARALAQDTPLIILDEPTTHLIYIK
jgi:ABC-type Mn2+/Zn2+ transport system ATPase subunit